MNFIKFYLDHNQDIYINLDTVSRITFDRLTRTMSVDFIDGHVQIFHKVNSEVIDILEETFRK